ncbi:MAG TPA: 3-phosphoshikimate 1-carboxyvinyltransferase [Chloroflexia bacterium]|jgi:3-phosphoshikimate 1-carboxyvinyltransferase
MISGAGPAQSLTVEGPIAPFDARLSVPGDKSISHRAAMLGGIAEGVTHIRNFLPANDCLATLDVMRGLGVAVEYRGDEVLVHGRGMEGLIEPPRPLECGGSGTTMRLMSGLLAGQPFYSVLAGNAQLSRRPMDRVARPLREMGATILGREGGRLAPLSIQGGNLHGISYRPPVASAQIKSAVLLAGLFAQGETAVEEPTPTRDHTERMLMSMGADMTVEGDVVRVQASQLRAIDVDVPGDISSAAFILAAAAIVPGSRVVVEGVGVNPGRTGFLHALERMGAKLHLHDERESNGEPVADLEVSHAALRGIAISAEDVPGMIDELPLLAVVATQAEGVTEVRGAAELRVKETDRIATTAAELTRMGAHIEALPDGFRVYGPTPLLGVRVSSHGDHRLAMSLCIAALVARGVTTVEDTECAGDSFPGFEGALRTLIEGGRGSE